MVAASFDKQDPVPFFKFKEKIYFAGIGLNLSFPVKTLDAPNFSCKRPVEFIYRTRDADVFFGNHINVFKNLTNVNGKQVASMIKAPKKIPKEGFHNDNLGRIFGKLRRNEGIVYFPAAPCHFDASLGEIYSGLSTFYLLDPKASAVSPYFGVAYYKEESDEPELVSLVEQTINRLGKKYKIVHRKDDKLIIATHEINSFDDEGDPLDLCLQPRDNKVIAIIKTRGKNSDKPEYLLLANIAKLCEYGDRLSTRLAAK